MNLIVLHSFGIAFIKFQNTTLYLTLARQKPESLTEIVLKFAKFF